MNVAKRIEVVRKDASRRERWQPVNTPSPRYSSRFVRAFVAAFWPFARVWFRPRVEGIEQVPRGACLVVANHSGFAIMEIFLLLAVWTRRHGTRVPFVGLSHDVGMRWFLAWGVERIGGVRASPENARAALDKGLPVIVFPGGDLDALRPFSARYEVRWGERSGFVRLARDARVPIVPLAICGSHAQYTGLPGGRWFAKAFGLTRHRIATWPVPLGALWPVGASLGALLGLWSPAWIAAAFVLAGFPNPTRVDLKFLEPLEVPAALPESEVAPTARKVRDRIQGEVTRLAQTRRTPWG